MTHMTRLTFYAITIRLPGSTRDDTVRLCADRAADIGKHGADVLCWFARSYGVSPLALDYSVRAVSTVSTPS